MAAIDDDHRGAMGLLAPGMEHRIVDPETGAALGEGERGDTFDADGWFATGDICSIRDGHLFFHDRRDAMRGQIVGALLVPREGTMLDREAMLAAARSLLSSYKVPRKLAIVSAAPATGTNKLDRRAATRMIEALG